jgi:hypothetical protein
LGPLHSTHLSAADRIGPFAGAGLTEECDKQFGLVMEIAKGDRETMQIPASLSVRYWQR